MAVERTLHTPEAEQLLELTGELVGKEIAPRAAEDEENSVFPRDVFATLGEAGLLGLPYPGEYGGGDVIVWDWGTWAPGKSGDPAQAVLVRGHGVLRSEGRRRPR